MATRPFTAYDSHFAGHAVRHFSYYALIEVAALLTLSLYLVHLFFAPPRPATGDMLLPRTLAASAQKNESRKSSKAGANFDCAEGAKSCNRAKIAPKYASAVGTILLFSVYAQRQ